MFNKNIFIRSFCLQGFWNYSKFQNIGVLFIFSHRLRALYKDDTRYKRAIVRYLEAFNTNPAMCLYSAGAMLKQEEKIAQLQDKASILKEEHEWRIIRSSTASTAASIGDRLFWATLKPLSLVIYFVILSATEIHVLEDNAVDRAILGRVIFALIASLLLYNLPAFLVRRKGYRDSYKGTEDDFYGLIKLNWNKTISFLKTLGQVLTVFIIFYGLYISFRGLSIDADSITKVFLLIAFIILSGFMRKLNMPNIFLYIIATVVFGIAAFLA